MADDLNINIGANPAGIESGSRRAKVALKGVADGGKDLDAALRRLRSSIDPTYVAMERYNKVHAENLQLLRAGLVTRQEYNAAMKVAKAALQEETAAIQRNTAEGRAAIAAQRAAKAQALAESRAAAAAEALAARQAAAAARQAAREAAAEVKAQKAAERQAAREAAAEAKRVAREQAAVERAAKQQAAADAKAAAQEATAARRAQAAAERQAARETAAAEKAARAQMRADAKAASAAASAAAKEAAAAKRQEAAASKAAAQAAREQANAEKADAQALQELRSSVDPAFAAQNRYNQTMQKATSLLMQNKLQTGEWSMIQKNARAQMDLNVRSLGRQNAMYVQLGYQAQDVTASLASGINPLVILAQQGGQTAAALSTMGGTAGRVAAFFAGPWGAAIIGATMLLGYLWNQYSTGEKATKDLMDAEDEHAMSIKDLTEALEQYIKTQREANETAAQGKLDQAVATRSAQLDVINRMTQAQNDLNNAEQAYATAVQINGAASPYTLIMLARLKLAQRAVENLKTTYKDAVEAAQEAGAAYAQTTSDMSDLDRKKQDEQTAALGAYRREFQAAGNDVSKQALAVSNYQTALNEIKARYLKLQETEKKNNRELADQAKQIFQSREQAIGVAGHELQKEGYSVSENKQFGGVTANHPGMGNSAHALYAIDVNIPGAGKEALNPVTKRRMDEMVAAYQARGFRVLWNGKVYNPYGQGATYDIPAGQNQHKDHVHMEAPQSIVGKPAGSSLADSLVSDAQKVAEEQKKLAEEAVKDRVAQLNEEQELNREDLEQVIKLQDEKIKVLQDFYGKDSKEAVDAQRERVRQERQYGREILEEKRKQLQTQLQLDEAAQDRDQAARAASLEMQGAVFDYATQQGILTEQQGLVKKAQILDQEYAQRVAHEDRMFQLHDKEIRAELALENLTKKEREDLNRQLEVLEADHLGKMQQLNLGYARNVQQVQLQAAQLTAQKWQEIGQTLSGSLTSAFQGLWTRQQTLQQAFINGADQMVYKFVDMGAKMFENWFMRQMGMTAVQRAQDTARTVSTTASQAAQTAAVTGATATQIGSKVAAATTEQAINTATTGAKVASEAIKTGAAMSGAAAQTGAAATAGMSEITTDAAVSAAGAYKSTVVIPFIGPVAAPAAAALALAAVLGFGALISAKGGMGEVPDDQLAMVHKKEMILPAWIAEPMRRAFVAPRGNGSMMSAANHAASVARENSGGSSNAANFYYQPQHTNMGASFEELLRTDGRSLRKWLNNEVRNGSLKFK